jgi:hypothetical protein
VLKLEETISDCESDVFYSVDSLESSLDTQLPSRQHLSHLRVKEEVQSERDSQKSHFKQPKRRPKQLSSLPFVPDWYYEVKIGLKCQLPKRSVYPLHSFRLMNFVGILRLVFLKLRLVPLSPLSFWIKGRI